VKSASTPTLVALTRQRVVFLALECLTPTITAEAISNKTAGSGTGGGGEKPGGNFGSVKLVPY
jgi:hypothetical protein